MFFVIGQSKYFGFSWLKDTQTERRSNSITAMNFRFRSKSQKCPSLEGNKYITLISVPFSSDYRENENIYTAYEKAYVSGMWYI